VIFLEFALARFSGTTSSPFSCASAAKLKTNSSAIRNVVYMSMPPHERTRPSRGGCTGVGERLRISVNALFLLFALPLFAAEVSGIQEIGEVRVRESVDLRKIKRNCTWPTARCTCTRNH
jgi:hypothetical protein